MVFLFAATLGWIFGEIGWSLMVGISLSALVAFVDDIRSLPAGFRLIFHFTSLGFIFWGLGLFQSGLDIGAISLLGVIAILFTGWVNTFNFMDGINGISGAYALVTLLSLHSIELSQEFGGFIELVGLSILVFGTYNFRKRALAFAGDVGSISLAFILGFLMLDLILKTESWTYILFFSVYGLDSVLTIFHRLLLKQNIFEAHRFHLYQIIANHYRQPHLGIGLSYALIQLGINYFLVKVILSSQNQEFFSFLLLLLLAAIYIIIRSVLLKRAPDYQ